MRRHLWKPSIKRRTVLTSNSWLGCTGALVSAMPEITLHDLNANEASLQLSIVSSASSNQRRTDSSSWRVTEFGTYWMMRRPSSYCLCRPQREVSCFKAWQAVLVCAEHKTADLAAHALVRQPAQ